MVKNAKIVDTYQEEGTSLVFFFFPEIFLYFFLHAHITQFLDEDIIHVLLLQVRGTLGLSSS